MKRTVLAGVAGLSCLVLTVDAAPAKALMIAPQPVALRVATAEVVVVGKVTSIEEKSVSAPRFPNDKQKGEYQIAIVKIEDPILGAKGLTHLRVGFLPAPTGGPAAFRPPLRPVNLVKDQEVCLFLTPHFEANFFIIPIYFDAIDKKGNDKFDDEVKEAKKAAKLLADPDAGLQSKNAEERYLTAALLIAKYRTAKPFAGGPLKQEPIDAARSKRILEALADADWSNTAGRPGMLNPQSTFFRLGLTPQDGWEQPKDFRQLPAIAKQWLKDHADSYRVKQFVADEKKDDKE
jgi:hypothetical protein